jgi:hypothetical protein
MRRTAGASPMCPRQGLGSAESAPERRLLGQPGGAWALRHANADSATSLSAQDDLEDGAGKAAGAR